MLTATTVDRSNFFLRILFLLSQFFHFHENLLNCLGRYIRGDLVQNAKAKFCCENMKKNKHFTYKIAYHYSNKLGLLWLFFARVCLSTIVMDQFSEIGFL